MLAAVWGLVVEDVVFVSGNPGYAAGVRVLGCGRSNLGSCSSLAFLNIFGLLKKSEIKEKRLIQS